MYTSRLFFFQSIFQISNLLSGRVLLVHSLRLQEMSEIHLHENKQSSIKKKLNSHVNRYFDHSQNNRHNYRESFAILFFPRL